MSVQYRKVYANNGVVAFAPMANASCDHLFVWSGTNADQSLDLPEMLQQWSTAPNVPGSPRQRTLLFCQSFDSTTLAGELDKLKSLGLLPQIWGMLAYWSQDSFKATVWEAVFPNGTGTPIVIGDLKLIQMSGLQPSTLDDFAIAASGDGQSLDLSIAGAHWTLDQVDAGGAFNLRLGGDRTAAAGAIKLSLDWPATPTNAHPVARAKVAFVAMPSGPVGGMGGDSRLFATKLAETVTPGTKDGARCAVHLDPRDASGAAWYKNSATAPPCTNSTIQFGDALIVSSLFSVKGTRFTLNPTPTGRARLGFICDRYSKSKGIHTSGVVIFHPEGLFAIPLPVLKTGEANICATDLIAGAAATEFIDLAKAGVGHVEFVPGQPAFLVDNAAKAATQALNLTDILDDVNRHVVTSHVRFHDENKQPVQVSYHSQPASAPLFKQRTSSAGAVLEDLIRQRIEYGRVSSDTSGSFLPIPLFWHAGYQSQGNLDADLLGFESTHLAQYRRMLCHRPQAAAENLLTPEAAAPTPQHRAVTQQGLLADVDANGFYKKIYFGNPNSGNLAADFTLSLAVTPGPNDSARPLWEAVQEALSSDQLFVVVRNPNSNADGVDVFGVLDFDAQISFRDGFTFSLTGSAAAATGPQSATKAAGQSKTFLPQALILKYVKDKAVFDLLLGTQPWACQRWLAPKGNRDLQTWLSDWSANWARFSNPKPDLPPELSYLQTLHDILFDPEWQGILAIGIPMDGTPDIINALSPGLSSGTPGFTAQYIGLNALPVRQRDLATGGTPMRPVSSFGYLHYANAEASQRPVAPPSTSDREPGKPGDDGRSRKYSFVLRSLDLGIANSQISDFSAELDVSFDHLFWDPVADDSGLIKLIGHYESRPSGPNGQTADVFSFTCAAPIVTFGADSYLQELNIRSAQITVVSAVNKRAAISIDAGLKLNQDKINEAIGKLPLFNVDAIRLSSFGFNYGYGSIFDFGFDASGISADISFGDVGDYLASIFPLTFKGMTIAFDKLLNMDDLQYTPLGFGGFGKTFQFGIVMEIDLGSLGQLMGIGNGFKLPFLFGWGGGGSPGLTLGIKMPTVDGSIDIGIQQFIRLQADKLMLTACPPNSLTELKGFAIGLANPRVSMLGTTWPSAGTDLSLAAFVPASSDRKTSWALGVDNQGGTLSICGGYRVNLSIGDGANDIASACTAIFSATTNQSDLCALFGLAENPSNGSQAQRYSGWSLAAQYKGDVTARIVISDPNLYGIGLDIPPFGALAVLYRRVNDQLGIFSIEYTLPDYLREIQVGAATVRLPVFRLEIHTDGGFLADFGYPWNYDFSRSAQVEIGLFLGSGGLYVGGTSMAASQLLNFEGGQGYFSPDPKDISRYFGKVVRVGFSARAGVGRSFTLGALKAEASITIFGALEGAFGYLNNGDATLPDIFALRGTVGLMTDISATVDFAIITASAHLLAYADVGLEIRQILARSSQGANCIVQLPVTVFADLVLTVTATVQIHVGCVSVSISLSFNATWHYEEALNDIHLVRILSASVAALAPTTLLVAAAPHAWDSTYRAWPNGRPLTIYTTVLPCMAQAADVGETGGLKTCAVAMMLLPILDPQGGLGDLARFLVGWLLRPDLASPGTPDQTPITLADVSSFLDLPVWDGFTDALQAIVTSQFTPKLATLASGQQVPLAVIPMWPGSGVTYQSPDQPSQSVAGAPLQFKSKGQVLSAADAIFADYCTGLVLGTLSEIRLILRDPTLSPNQSRAWGEIWQDMFKL